MAFEVLVGPKAAKTLRKMDEATKNRIKDRILELREQPERHGKRLTYSDYWSLRIGDYRVIYRIEKKDSRVLVIFVGHRGTVYDDFSKII